MTGTVMALNLARAQFAFTVSFHFIFPAFSIGLASYLAVLEALWLKTGKPVYDNLYRYWIKIFAIVFAMGVVSGIVLSYQFGTNWAVFSDKAGPIIGPLMAYEVLSAFFLEAGFLGVMLFGIKKVGAKLHFLATCMVCLGAHFSAVWIVVANSWMQTPAGFKIVGEGMKARAEVTDFWAVVFNPSSMDRLFHTLCGAWQAGAFLVVSVSAWYLLKRRHEEFARASLRVGLGVGLIASLLQLVSGHASGQGLAKNQPVKLAAFEGLYETSSHAPLTLFGWVDEKNQEVIGPKIPGLLSFLTYNDTTRLVTGLREAAPDAKDRPPVNVTFQLFHLMVAVGFWMILISAIGFLYFRRGSRFEKRWLLWLRVLSVLGPQIANQAGWFAAEVGRQPWIVQGLLRTSDGLSAVVKANTVLAAILLFSAVYILLFAVFVYLLNDKIKHGPDDADLIPSGKLALPERSRT